MISTMDYAGLLRRLERVARRYYPADPSSVASDAIADLGADADYVELCRRVQDRARNLRRSDARRARHERAAGEMRGTTYIGETDADSVNPLDYLSLISDPRTRDIVNRSINGQTQAEIAIALGLSNQRVSQLFASGIQEIRENMESD
jgi:DNA-directed RNA polymerase specialized sigma24 family protein